MKIRHRNRIERVPGQSSEGYLIALWFVAMPAAELLLMGFGLWMLMSGLKEGAWLTLLAAALLYISWIYIQASMAEYSFSADGVTVKYPMERQHQYSWRDFQQICVCYYSRASEMYGYSVICLVKKGEKRDAFGRWKTSNYFRYRSILCLDYSCELLAEIRTCCPYEVPDLRDRGNYRL